tara:strand:+ start:430 stop:939 length:510 start_codon:yes stop_codon:yes gene_type:complete
MNPFKLYRFIELYIKFVQNASSFAKSNDALHDYSEAEIADLQSSAKRIIRISIFCLVAGGLILPITVPWIRYLVEPMSLKDALELSGCGLIFSIFLMPMSLMMGASFGCLFASPEFMRSPFGTKWMELVGTENVIASRIICALVSTILFGVLIGYVFFIFACHIQRPPG